MTATPSDPPGRWAALGVLALATLLSMTTWFSASAVLPQLRHLWHLGDAGAAALTLAVQLGFVTGALVAAATNAADLVAARTLIQMAAYGAAAVNLGLLLVNSALPAVALRFVTGVFLAGVYPPALRQMGTWFRQARGTALGVMVGALTLGSALPHLVNGLGGTNWRAVIVSTSVLTATGGLLAGRLVHDGPFPFPRAVFDPRQVGKVLASPGVRLATIGYFGHMWELYAMWAWFVVFASSTIAAHGYRPASSAPLLTFAVIGVGAVGSWLGGVVGDSWGRTRSTILAMGVSGTCAVVIGPLRTGPLWLFVVVALLWGLTVVADSAQFSTMVTELSDQRYVGTALTLQLAVGFTLTTVTIALVPAAQHLLGWGWVFAILAPGPLLGIVAMLRLRRLPQALLIAGGRR